MKNKTRITSLVLALIMLVSVFVPAMSASAANLYTSQANQGTYIVPNMSEYSCGVTVRTTSSYNYGSKLGIIYPDRAFKYLDKTETDEHGRDWYKIQYTSSKTGWVCENYVHKVTVHDRNKVLTTSSKINMRKGPGADYPSYGLCHANTYYSIIGCAGEQFSVTGTKWYQVMDNSSRVFWFKGTLLSKVEVYTTVTCDVNSGTYFTRTYNFKAASYARSGPSTDYTKVRSSTFNTKAIIDITSVKLNTKGELWYGVQIRDGGKLYNGYVLGSLLK